MVGNSRPTAPASPIEDRIMTRATASWVIVAGFSLVWLGLSVTLIARASFSYQEPQAVVEQAPAVQSPAEPDQVRRALLDAPAISFATSW